MSVLTFLRGVFMTSDDAIRAIGLTRYFGSKAVVRDLNFRLPRGVVVGFLGLNGAGKTTTIRMLMGFLAPTRGQSLVLGHDSQHLTADLRARIGHTVEGHFLYRWMSVADCERFGRETHPRWNADIFFNTVQRFGIEVSSRVGHLSRGQRAGVSLASTLSSYPELLILDDPALGLDPVSRRALNETILDFCESGDRSVLMSSHLLDDVERVADRIAVMVGGRLLVDTTMDRFCRSVSAWNVVTTEDPASTAMIPGLIHSRPRSDGWIITVADPNAETEKALLRLKASSVEPIDVSFDDAVLAYLSRERNRHSFLTGTAS